MPGVAGMPVSKRAAWFAVLVGNAMACAVLGPFAWEWATLVVHSESPLRENPKLIVRSYARVWDRSNPTHGEVLHAGRVRALWSQGVDRSTSEISVFDSTGVLVGMFHEHDGPDYYFDGVVVPIDAMWQDSLGLEQQSLYVGQDLVETRTAPPWFTPEEIEAAFEGRWP